MPCEPEENATFLGIFIATFAQALQPFKGEDEDLCSLRPC